MKNQITPRDYELISAYLDNQLGSKDRAQLEARLKVNAELRRELHEISKTRVLVRTLPRLKAPRNYFITDRVSVKSPGRAVGRQPRMRLYPSLGIVSAVATILLALVIFGDRLLLSTSPVALAPLREAPSEAIASQQVQSIAGETPLPSEVAPQIMMSAPAEATPTPSTGAYKSQTEQATQTGIYPFPYSKSPTPGRGTPVTDLQTDIAKAYCEKYYASGALPTERNPYNCPTPTCTTSHNLQGIQPTATPTPAQSPPAALLQSEAPQQSMKALPTSEAGSPDGLTQPGLETGAGNPNQAPGREAEANPDLTFPHNILLAAEISLAAIAIIAGVIAILLRIRAG